MILNKIKNKISKINNDNNEIIVNYDEVRNEILKTNRKYLSNYTFDTEPLVSIIILNRDGLKYLKILFDDFASKTNYLNFEIIVVDNASSDNSVDYLKSLDLDIRIIENKKNTSFSKANNDAVDIAKGEYILFLNNDIEPTFGWLNEMMGTILYNDNVGAVGAKLIYPHINNPQKEKHSFTIQHYGGIFREHVCDKFDYAARHQYKFSKNIFDDKFLNNKKCIIATAAVFLIKKDTFLKLHGFDENYWYGFEDVDLNLKLYKNGYDVVVASSALLMHYESVTRKKEKKNNYVVLNEKWGDYLFKELLYDKLEKNYFLTDKKLKIAFIGYTFRKYRLFKKIIDAGKYIASQKYRSILINGNSLNISRDSDILVSLSIDYNIDKINARDNLIKVLLLSDDEFDYNTCLNYDIIITTIDNLNIKNSYKIDNLDNLGVDLISIIYSHYNLSKKLNNEV